MINKAHNNAFAGYALTLAELLFSLKALPKLKLPH